MSDQITLTCPSCGGKLLITPEINRFACSHCGNEHIVQRGIGTISLKPIIEGIKDVQQGVDKTASELAIKRLEKEIASLKAKRTHDEGGWYGNIFGWGCLAVFMAAAPAIFCGSVGVLSNTSSISKILMFLAPIVVLISVFLYGRNNKKTETNNWQRLDDIIRAKEMELKYHLDIVDRFNY